MTKFLKRHDNKQSFPVERKTGMHSSSANPSLKSQAIELPSVKKSKPRSAIGKEVWFNPNSVGGNLIIIDRFSGKVQSFTLDKEWVESRYKYEMTEEDKSKAEEGYQTSADPEDVYGANGWKRMRRMEESG